ncbi:MAG: SMC-Scp complex subunit ScpB [Desulfobacterales bacterium]|nr:SMC-Scp complex subunit ScpB [Desulfobacterales bacterium]
MDELKKIIESLLFVAEDPLTAHTLSKAAGNREMTMVRQALEELIQEYDDRDGGFFLARIAGGYQFRTSPENTQWIKRLIQPNAPRLSKAALETLAIIAYKQPVIRADIERVRGVDSGGVIRMLMERKLLRVLGRKEIPGRPLIYATTKIFLQVFDLKDLRDLPSPKEIEDMALESGSTATPDDSPGEAKDSDTAALQEPLQGSDDQLPPELAPTD